jgi:hypothetical protein
MNIPQHPTLLRRMIEARRKKLAARRPVLTASLVRIAKHCGRKGCHCQTGQKHVGHYLTFKEAAKTRTIYVPLDMIEDVRLWIDEHRRLRQLDKEISQLCVALVRSHVTQRNRKRGRS